MASAREVTNETCNYYGRNVPLEPFHEKFGSYWLAIFMVPILKPGSRFICAIITGIFNSWHPLVLVPALALGTSCGVLTSLETPTPAIGDKKEYVGRIFGKPWSTVYTISNYSFYASLAVWHVAIFIRPPFDEPLVATAFTVVTNFLSLFGLAGIEIPRYTENFQMLRMCRVATLASMWLDFGTDFASGVTAVNGGYRVFGILILVAGCLELGVTLHHTSSGLIAHTKKTLLIHALLELPIVVITFIVMFRSARESGSPWYKQTAYIVSITQTFASLGGTLIWLLVYPMLSCGPNKRAAAVLPVSSPDKAPRAPVEAPPAPGLPAVVAARDNAALSVAAPSTENSILTSIGTA